MELSEADRKSGTAWFLGAGAFALALSFFLATVDNTLSTSKREEIIGDTLRELRTAQASLGYNPPDSREASNH